MKRKMFEDREIYCPMCNSFICQATPDNIFKIMKCKKSGCRGQFRFIEGSLKKEKKNDNTDAFWNIASIELSANIVTDGFDNILVSDIIKSRSNKDKFKNN